MSPARWVPGDIEVLVFDVIGTLVDDEAAFAGAARELASAAGLENDGPLGERWTASLDRRMQAVIDGDAAWQPHRHLMQASAEEAVTGSGGRWSDAAGLRACSLAYEYRAWPDVAPGTLALRRRRLVAALSNGDVDVLARLAHANAISWDIVLSTSTIGSFKPDPRAYEFAVETLRIEPARTLFVAAHPWDLRAAARHGFRTAFVARPHAERPDPDDGFDLEVDDLLGLVRALGEDLEH